MKKKNCCPCTVLKGRVYFDLNNNNQFNPGEEGVFTLVLTYPDNSVLQFNTESDGSYRKKLVLKRGSYTLSVQGHSGFSYDFVKGCSDCIEHDFAIKTMIEGIIWKDVDKDGIRSGTEERLANATIDLYDEDYNLVVQSTTTNANGEYSFVVPAGSYYIYPSVSGYAYTLENQGSDETVDSDFDTSDTFGFITVLQDQKLKYDIGFYRVADYSVESTRTIEIHGATPVEKVITISELNGISNSNITFYTFASNRLTINWNPSLITMDSQLVNNLDWHYAMSSSRHIWTYQGNGGVFPPNGVSKIGINYTYDPLGSSGHTSIGFYLVQNHLEENYSNNAAIDIINFFGA